MLNCAKCKQAQCNKTMLKIGRQEMKVITCMYICMCVCTFVCVHMYLGMCVCMDVLCL